MAGWSIFVGVMLVLIFIVAFFSFGRGWIASYDEAHPVWLTCTIESSKASAASTHAGRGIGSYVDQVDLQTENCGHLVLRDGVSSQNSENIAARFKKDEKYRIQLGEASIRLRGLLSALGTVPEVRGYHLAR
ncbi:hypothetical protein ACRQ4B_00800 [Curtobacterium sp. SP.BCo]|uniref:hypothetical protein n=1 Tax=Curtobacterium sp. SP.BCo TaxID=3435229 RepID=UPI003F73652C